MERLTNSIDYCQLHCDFGNSNECFFQENSKCYEKNIYEKLREYENLEEQGLLLRLPTEAYFIKNNNVCKGWVQEVVYSPCRKLLLDVRYDDNSLDSYRGYVGNTIFLTQAEAEQKLKEMESGNNGTME